MERRNPKDAEMDTQSDLSSDSELCSDAREGALFARTVKRILDPLSIPQTELDCDLFLGEESVEEYLQRVRKQDPRGNLP
jgi:hypothetical protein